MFRNAAFVLAVALCAAPALAQDAPAPAAKSADQGGGSVVRVTLTNGRTLDGALRVEGGWERLDPKSGWTRCKKDEAGASLRLWRGSGENAACMTLGAAEVKSFEDAPSGGVDTGVADADTEAKRSAEAARARKARDERFAAADAATKKKQDEEAARKKAHEDEERAKADALLLAKFPPPAWSAERVKEIEKRQLLMDLLPTAEEREFIAVYPAWARALAAKEAKAAAEKQAAEDKKADAERKAAEAKDKSKAKDSKPAEDTSNPGAKSAASADEPAPAPAKEDAKPAEDAAPAPAPSKDESKTDDPAPPAPAEDAPKDQGGAK
jgi:hypothetical protein